MRKCVPLPTSMRLQYKYCRGVKTKIKKVSSEKPSNLVLEYGKVSIYVGVAIKLAKKFTVPNTMSICAVRKVEGEGGSMISSLSGMLNNSCPSQAIELERDDKL